MKKTEQMNFMILDLFAGTFSVTKGCLDRNALQNTPYQISSIFAFEKNEKLSTKFVSEYENGKAFQNKKIPFFKTYVGDIRNPKLETKFFEEFEKNLQNTIFKTSEKTPIGILVFAGPPCVNYSSLQGLNVRQDYMVDPSKFEAKQKASDRFVQKTLLYFEKVQKIGQKHASNQRLIHSALVLENPWSVENLNISFANDPFFEKGIQYQTKLALRSRPFLQPYLFKNGGFLKMTKHNWCVYDVQNFPKKPTAIFSTIDSLESQICPHGNQKHPVQVLDFSNAADRGRYPPEFIQYCLFSFFSDLQKIQNVKKETL